LTGDERRRLPGTDLEGLLELQRGLPGRRDLCLAAVGQGRRHDLADLELQELVLAGLEVGGARGCGLLAL